MIVISQLLQVLQGTEATAMPPGESGVEQAPGGLAKLFGAMLEQARSILGEQSALSEGVPAPATSLVSEAADGGETEGQEVLEQSIERPPIEQAASILVTLGKLEGLQLEHAAVALEGLSKMQAVASDELVSMAGTPKEAAAQRIVSAPVVTAQIGAPFSEEAALMAGTPKGPAAQRTISAPVVTSQIGAPSSEEAALMAGTPKDLAAQRTISAPVVTAQVIAPSSEEAAPMADTPKGPAAQRIISAPLASAQVVAPLLKAPSEILQLDPVLLESGTAVPRHAASVVPQGLVPAQGLMKAVAEKMAPPKGQVSVTAVQNTQAVLDGDGESGPRALQDSSMLHEIFARAVTKQHVQAAPKQGAADGLTVTGTLEPLEPLLVAAKSQALDLGKALMPPAAAEAAKVAQPPPADTVLARAATERPPPEVVQIRDAGQFIIKTVRYHAGRHDEVVTVRLVPRSLGEMQIAVSTRGDSVEIVITASSQVARGTLEAQISGLREALMRDGTDVAKVTIQTFMPGDQGPGHSGLGNSATSGHAARHATKFTAEPPEPETGPRASPEPSAMHEGSLNMFV